MGAFSDNFYSWLDRQHAAEKAAMDGEFKEELHPRESKGKEGGGRFTKKPETLEKEDSLNPTEAPAKKGNMKGSKYRALRDAQAKNCSGMGTFDLISGKPVHHSSGYQVSFQEATTESTEHGSYIPDEEYDRKVEAIKKELGSEPALGHWDEDEISFHCNSLEKALAVARRHNQEAIWNWAKDEAIKNEDFVGRTHWTDRNNHATKKYHQSKPNPNTP